MKAKSYKLKYVPTEEELIKNKFREGGSWINKKAKWFFTSEYYNAKTRFDMSISICFNEDLEDWNDFDNVEVLDEDFCQPYTPFYGDNYKKDIHGFKCLEWCIEKYNKFMDGFDFLEEVTIDG